MSNYNPQGGGLQYRGTAAQSPPNTWVFNHAPTDFDTQGFSLGDFWVYLKNNATNQLYVLVDIRGDADARRSLATWSLFSTTTSGGILTLTGNDSVAVSADTSGNINLIGTGPITVAGTTNTETISVAVATTTNQGTVVLSTNNDSIGGTSTNTAVVPSTLSAKLGAQTLNGVAYGNGTSNALLWTAEGANNTVLTGTGTAPIFSGSPTLTNAILTGFPAMPSNDNVATVGYVNSVAAGFTFIALAKVATTANLSATYNNGAAGVGATLTNNSTQVALSIDGVALSLTDRVLVKNQSAQADNGIYTVTTVGSGSSNWVLTRSTDYNMAPSQIKPGNLVPISMGTVNANTLWLQTETVTTIGTDPIVFVTFGITPLVPLPIDAGGTNATSFAKDNGTVVFDGTELISIDPGTTGQVLTSNGAAALPTFQTSSSGGVIPTVYNSPGPFTWTANVNTKIVEIFGWGGGGGGAAGFGTNGSGGGGGGGCFYYKVPIAFLNSPVSGVVGAGGGGGIGGDGSIGGPSSFGNFSTGGTPTRPPVNLLPLSGGGVFSGRGGTGGFVMSMTNSLAFTLSSPNTLLTLNPGAQGSAINNSFGTMLSTGGGGGTVGTGGSIVNTQSGATIIAGGTAGTSLSPNGGNGNSGYTDVNFMTGGTGGGAGFAGSTGTGGTGGFPGGGGGAGGSGGGNGGAGANGLVIVIEYT